MIRNEEIPNGVELHVWSSSPYHPDTAEKKEDHHDAVLASALTLTRRVVSESNTAFTSYKDHQNLFTSCYQSSLALLTSQLVFI